MEEQTKANGAFQLRRKGAGGLTATATVGKCCTVTDEFVACRIRGPQAMLK